MMKYILLFFALVATLCEAQEESSFSCGGYCRTTGECPSIRGIIYTVRILSSDCRRCIINECGSSFSRENITSVAECMFMARPGCSQCKVSNESLEFRRGCISCKEGCEGQIESGVTPTFRPRRPSPNRRPSLVFSRINFRICRCEAPTMCPSERESREEMMEGESESCRDCIERECSSFAQGDRSELPQCIMEARAQCSGCSPMNVDQEERMANCSKCVRRCSSVTLRRNATLSSFNCNMPCTRRGLCPETDAIITTIERTTTECKECITEQCGEITDRDREGTANCMFQARLTCDTCTVSAAARAQRERCRRCQEECEDEEAAEEGSGNMSETTP